MKITIFNIYFLKILSLGLKFIFIWQDNHLTFTFVHNRIQWHSTSERQPTSERPPYISSIH